MATTRRADMCTAGAVPDPQVVAEAWDAWRAEVDFAARFVAQAPSFDITGNDPWMSPIAVSRPAWRSMAT